MSHPDLPDGYYLAKQKGQRPGIVQRITLYGESHWRNRNDERMRYDPRMRNYDLTPLAEIAALQQRLDAMTARAERVEAAHADLLAELRDLKGRLGEAEA